MKTIKGSYTNAEVMIDLVEESCLKQIQDFCDHPAFTNPIAIMPDAHAGKGSCIGFTMPLSDKVIPNVIGVDIGCGVLAVNLGAEIGIDLNTLDKVIRDKVPTGKNVHETDILDFEKDFPWETANNLSTDFSREYAEKFKVAVSAVTYDKAWFSEKVKDVGGTYSRVTRSIGTLGGGNHFIELSKSQKGDLWLIIHTGSRNFGKLVCEYWQNQIKSEPKAEYLDQVNSLKKSYSGKELQDQIEALKQKKSDKDYLEGTLGLGYLFDMIFAQVYAEFNRRVIKDRILEVLGITELDTVESTHNFIDFRDLIIRKGAIRSYTGEKLLVPLNMRDGTLLCEGSSNPAWNFSCSHGAGRSMSRMKAKALLSMDTFQKQMEGIHSSSVCLGTLDESPGAYKDSEMIIKSIGPSVTILDRLLPIYNLKDSED